MFGTVVVNRELLNKEERERYSAFYCGLCRCLGEKFGSSGQKALSYDFTFMSILLSSFHSLKEEDGQMRCALRPAKHGYIITEATRYSADMNLFLAYYQALDDWNDDANASAKKKADELAKFLPNIRQRYAEKCLYIEAQLANISEMEKANELNPDLPANCFGKLMAALFSWPNNTPKTEAERILCQTAAALGRFIYLLDAVNDLKQDIKKQRYNPLISLLDTDFTPVLTLMMAECTESFEKLELKHDAHILANILYSGVWQSYTRNDKRNLDIPSEERNNS